MDRLGGTGGKRRIRYSVTILNSLCALSGEIIQELGVGSGLSDIYIEHIGIIETGQVTATLLSALSGSRATGSKATGSRATGSRATTTHSVTAAAAGLTGNYRLKFTERGVQGRYLGLRPAGCIKQFICIAISYRSHAALLTKKGAVEEGLGGTGGAATLALTMALALTLALTMALALAMTLAMGLVRFTESHFYSVLRLFTGSSGLSLITTGRPLRWSRRASVINAFERGPWRSNICDASL